MDTRTGKAVVREFFERVYNQRDLDFVEQVFSPKYFEHTETGARSAQGARAILESAFATFPDLCVRVEALVEEGPLVAVRVQFEGTPHQTFAGAPPVDRRLHWEAMEFFLLDGPLITESWGSWPIHDMLQQMRGC